MPLVHVMFDGKPEVFCHVCRQHKAEADSLPCDDDKGTDGSCAHVQYAICDCDDDEHNCDICLNMGAPGSERAHYSPGLRAWLLPDPKETAT